MARARRRGKPFCAAQAIVRAKYRLAHAALHKGGKNALSGA
jgi:hypothetical protein